MYSFFILWYFFSIFWLSVLRYLSVTLVLVLQFETPTTWWSRSYSAVWLWDPRAQEKEPSVVESWVISEWSTCPVGIILESTSRLKLVRHSLAGNSLCASFMLFQNWAKRRSSIWPKESWCLTTWFQKWLLLFWMEWLTETGFSTVSLFLKVFTCVIM